MEFYISTKYELCRIFLKIRQTFSTIYNFPQSGLWNFIWFAEFSKPRENGNFVEFRPQIVEITPEIGRLRTDLASGHLRKNSISLKFLAHAQMQIFAPALCRIFFHNLLCGILKTPPSKKFPNSFSTNYFVEFSNRLYYLDDVLNI